MNDTFLTAEVESLVQGYVEGELTESECRRLRELLEAAPSLATPILTSLRMDALIRQTVLQGSTGNLAAHDAISHGEETARRLPKPRPRLAVRLALVACLMVLAALGTIFISSRRSQPAFAPTMRFSQTGSILYEYWNDIPGSTVTDLTSHPSFQLPPTGSELLGALEAPSSRGENYGARLRGYLHPMATGSYLFWIIADDAGELWLSEDEHADKKERICFLESWAPPREWTWKPSQQSQPIRLEAGHRYYIEALHKQGNAGDYLAIAWQPPGAMREIIPGRALSPFSQTNAGDVSVGKPATP